MTDRIYPDEPAGPFPAPPATFQDREGRTVRVEPFEDTGIEQLIAMYDRFDPSDRAQGIPPTNSDRISEWVDTLVTEGSNVVAWHDDKIVGHATLVPDRDEDAYELAIFVDQPYQGAGIGGQLIRRLLGHGSTQGVERVWLSVERWNAPAIALYEDVGFERAGTDSFEIEMSLLLETADDSTSDSD